MKLQSGKNKLIITAVIVPVIICALFFSMYYIASEADHDCCGGDCPICAEINLFQNVINQIGAGFLLKVIEAFLFLAVVSESASAIDYLCFATLVTHKIRMNN